VRRKRKMKMTKRIKIYGQNLRVRHLKRKKRKLKGLQMYMKKTILMLEIVGNKMILLKRTLQVRVPHHIELIA